MQELAIAGMSNKSVVSLKLIIRFLPGIPSSCLQYGHTKSITCFSDRLATNSDPGGGNK